MLRKKRLSILGVTALSFFIGLMLVLTFFNTVGALPTVVKPTIRDNELEDFEDDTVGLAPTEACYTYTGDYLVDNRVITLGSGYFVNMFRETQSLNLSGVMGSSAEFLFNESDYFSIDFSLAFWQDGGTLRFIFQNATTDSFEIDYVCAFNVSAYVNAMDLNDDGHVNAYDLDEIYLHYAETGAPGWIKEDLNTDGTVGYLDVSYYLNHYVSTDRVDVYYRASIIFGNVTQPYDELLYSFVPQWLATETGAFMLHSYFQFSPITAFGNVYDIFACAFQGRYDTPSTGWTAYNGYGIGNCDWDRINITSDTDTVAYLDNLTVCYTPYDLLEHSYSPAMDSFIDPDINFNVPITSSYYMVDNPGKTPMFSKCIPHVYQGSSSSGVQIDIPSSYEGHFYKDTPIGTDAGYYGAISSTSATYSDFSSTTMYLGQYRTPANHWRIYRDVLIFDTAFIPDDAIIDSAYLVFNLYETMNVTNNGNGNDWMNIEAFFDNGSIYPRNPVQLSDYDQSKYDMSYESVTFFLNDLSGACVLDTSRVNILGTTRCLLRESMECGIPPCCAPDPSWHENRMRINTTGAEAPRLHVTYHVPTYSWAPYGGYFGMVRNNATFSSAGFLADFSQDYYWYMEVSDYVGSNASYVWEFPQSGTVMGNKYCYHFTTNAYQQPNVTAWTPAHGATGISVFTNMTVTVNSYYNKTGLVEWNIYNNATHLWEYQGVQGYAFTPTNKTITKTNGFDYDTDVYWRVELQEDGYTGVYEYPNVTQAGVYIGGHKAWKFRTELNQPPWVVSYSPANNSHFNPWLDTIYINVTNNQTGEPVDYNFFLLEREQWSNGSWSDEIHWMAPYGSWFTDTMNFTWTPADTYALGWLFPPNGTGFAWAMQLSDHDNVVEFPFTGRYYNTSGNSAIGDYWVNYTADWELGNHLPSITVTYPTVNGHYTASQWNKNHNLHVTVNDPEGDDIFLLISVIYDGNITLAVELPLTTTLTYLDYGVYSDSIAKLANGTYDFDLSYYIPWDNSVYNITIIAQDSFHPRFVGYGNAVRLRLTLGTPPGKLYHLAFSHFTPSDGNMNGMDAITNGITGLVSINRADPADPGGLFGVGGHSANRPQVFFFLEDNEAKSMSAWSGISTPQLSDFKYRFIYQVSSGYVGFNGHYPWTKITMNVPTIPPRGQYNLAMGVFIMEHQMLLGYGDYQEFNNVADIEVDLLYSGIKPYGTFKFEYINPGFINFLLTDISTYTLLYDGDATFVGARLSFGTYPAGVTPNMGSDWGLTYTNFMESHGIGSAGIIVTLIIVCLFTIMPYVLIKRKGKAVPLTVLTSFAFFGLILSYGMGFLDLTVFVILFIVCMFILVFKAIAWITSHTKSLEELGGNQ